MNVTSLITVDYENIANWKLGENKPNTNPIKANLLDAQMNVSSFITKYYENKRLCRCGQNKPNQTQPVVSLPVLSLPVVSLSNQSKCRTYFKSSAIIKHNWYDSWSRPEGCDSNYKPDKNPDVFKRFRTFSIVFERFYLAYFNNSCPPTCPAKL